MKLRSLALNQFKKFTAPMRLDGINDGLNVVVGPNEMGKSTLLNALRAALFEKYSSNVNGGAKLVHPGGAKLVHLTLCGPRCWGGVSR